MFIKGRKIPESSFNSLKAILQKMGWTMDVPFFNTDGTFSGAFIGERLFVEAMMEVASGEADTKKPEEIAPSGPTEK